MPPLIEIKDLSYAYPDGTVALKNLSLTLEAGESLGLIGPNSAGKSTLLLHLNGLLLNEKNHIFIDNIKLGKNNLPVIRGLVGLVFQDPQHQLFMPTVFDDVAFGPINMGLPKVEVIAAVDAALTLVDMPSARHRSSHHLSYGEQKRIALATVLSMNPRILALDEPSSNLDPRHRWELINFLKNLKITKVIATHDLELVRELCTKVAVLNQGEIKAFGPASDILGNRFLLKDNYLEKP